jgi:hypothetical protein
MSQYLGRLDHLVGRYDDAERWFTEARELHERVRSPILVASTQVAWAVLADRNQGDDYTRAHAMAQAALSAAVAGGYGYIEADTRAVLDASRDEHRAITRAPRNTPAEAQPSINRSIT